MHHHRFQNLVENTFPLPKGPDPQVSPAGFMICPVALIQALPVTNPALQFAIYQQAFELAKEMARPSIVELDLLGVWN
jgi:hypothetical protein